MDLRWSVVKGVPKYRLLVEATDLYGQTKIATYADIILDANTVFDGPVGACYAGDWNVYKFYNAPTGVTDGRYKREMARNGGIRPQWGYSL